MRTRVEEEQAAAAEAKRKAQEAAKRRAAEEARRKFLAQHPVLYSGAELVFIGADRKRATQFVEAAAMEGLKKRKRLAYLIAYGCGFTTLMEASDSGPWAAAAEAPSATTAHPRRAAPYNESSEVQITEIVEAIRTGRVRITEHAYAEAEADRLTFDEIYSAVF